MALRQCAGLWGAGQGEENARITREIAQLQAERAEASARYTAFVTNTKIADSTYSTDLGELYCQVYEVWKADKQGTDFRHVTAALSARRHSMLVDMCVSELPFQLAQLGRNAQTFRKARLQSRENIETAESGALTAQARTTLLKQFETLMKYCDSLTDPDKATCRKRALDMAGGTLPVKDAGTQ